MVVIITVRKYEYKATNKVVLVKKYGRWVPYKYHQTVEAAQEHARKKNIREVEADEERKNVRSD